MKIIEQIKLPIYNEMELFESKFSDSMASRVSLLNRITHFIVKRKGKQMRPMFVFLCAKLLSKQNKVNSKTYRGAAIIELIHTATLVHDDIVDDSSQRRGFFSINTLWKNKIAVLVGDYLLSKGLLLSIDNDDFDLLKIISVAVRDMSQGELLQIEKSRKFDITEDIYYEIIKQKTASLLAACCALGAKSVDDSKAMVNCFHEFGEHIGMAFQIKDDLFDYGETKIGKPTGIDIKEKKITLPLIFAINNCDVKERRWLIDSVKRKQIERKTIKKIIDKVNELGGVKYANKMMHSYKKKALDILFRFPKNQYRDALELMANYVVERKV
ncbi:MAG: polyprenyl synthetase [Flavobacteriaceae bacterium]|nr:polyprenyl synthetase [Flavobacteriaceae bacterium]|tara:strand:- start:12666 stop:13646 length:981 start_codon:yes stop_codon:yes gene_type:complete